MAVNGPRDAAGTPTPDPLRESPPDDRFCDLILNGGVASGVVYPWAMVELARHYRFRNIGGNSVGAMAAALAAAAEYGRCHGRADAFEVLRRVPLELAKEERGDTQMLRLFQPAAGVKRIFDCFVTAIRHGNANVSAFTAWVLTVRDVVGAYRLGGWWLAGVLALLLPALSTVDRPWAWALPLLAGVAVLVVFEAVAAKDRDRPARVKLLLALLVLLVAAHAASAWALRSLLPALGALGWPLVVAALALARLGPEMRALKENGYGLCSGRAQPEVPGAPPTEEALIEWLHEGIQRSAGRERHDPPLTFEDLWNAPRAADPGSTRGSRESISLHMFSTNVTLGRPVSWPLVDRNARLFFCRKEWKRFFPPTLLDAIWNASIPYAPASDSDPAAGDETQHLRELPAGGMPIAIAARMSLSFPLLFSCIPVYAIDYEGWRKDRRLRQCQLTDGGLCTNFPIHLFDAAHPRWPTFGLMLSRRIAKYKNASVWLPEYHLDGRADNWQRNVPGAADGPPPRPLKGLFGLLAGMLSTALDWNDNLTSRLPHARNRVLRMALRPGEGQLNIAMSGQTILGMAHEYGTQGGKELIKRFVPTGAAPAIAWQEHLYVRAINQLQALSLHLRGYARAVTTTGFTKPLADILRGATQERPLRARPDRVPDPLGAKLTPEQAAALQNAVDAIAALERSLQDAGSEAVPYQPVPVTKLQLRSRM